ncbi:HORMA-1 domain-containing protein [Sneathiella sp.]|uniref:HORMA-1 domain-containing protein n=1 Tax=Sneathiella sp. TaxID=1964365 RepID=UPI002FE0CCDD
MSYSYTITESTTFTITHAKHMAAKVAADLKRMQRFYGAPSDAEIANYEAEVIEFLKAGYLGTVTYGFRRNGDWIAPTIQYTAKDLAGMVANDDDPGRVHPNSDTSGASFYSYLTYSVAWDALTSNEQEAFKRTLPLQRNGAPEPGIDGYLESDKTYAAGGRALDRSVVRSW